ncbi:MAG: sugar phosphate isomerase/epimerase [Ginsengibacter sp.]
MQSRRSFIKVGSLLSAGIILKPSELFRRNKKLIGLQLYTVRDAMAKDPVAALARVAQIGFNSVEGATYTGSELFYGMKAKDFAKVLKSNGLIMPSSHYRLGEDREKNMEVKGTMLHDWQKAVDDAAEVGSKYMVCAFLSPAERGNMDHYKYVAEQLNIAGEKCKKSGLQLCYHNHDFEFQKQDDKYPYDVLLNNTHKDLVKMEIDLYWASKANQNPVEMFKKHPGRFPLWHVKDMDKTEAKNFTEVGNGSIDFKEIFTHAKTSGMEYFFVEQDRTPGSPFDSMSQSIAYIKKNLL